MKTKMERHESRGTILFFGGVLIGLYLMYLVIALSMVSR
jgi:hypothetical protein